MKNIKPQIAYFKGKCGLNYFGFRDHKQLSEIQKYCNRQTYLDIEYATFNTPDLHWQVNIKGLNF